MTKPRIPVLAALAALTVGCAEDVEVGEPAPSTEELDTDTDVILPGTTASHTAFDREAAPLKAPERPTHPLLGTTRS